MKYKLSASFLTLVLGAVPLVVSAQEAVETRAILPQNTQKSMLTPNLAVNFQLNSTLGDKETEYYARIVEKILKSLPKKIALEGDERHLLSGSHRFDTLKVIAYFPSKGEEKSDDPFNKITKFYNIEFELPKEKKLQRLSKLGDEEPTIIERQESLDDFLAQVNTEISGKFKQAEDISKSIQPVVPIQPVTAQANSKKSKVAKTAPSAVVRQVHLDYFDNEIAFKPDQIGHLKRFASSLKGEKVQKVRVVTQTASSPFASWEEVQDNRVDELMRLFKAQGVDVGSIDFSFIHVKSTFKQSIELSF